MAQSTPVGDLNETVLLEMFDDEPDVPTQGGETTRNLEIANDGKSAFLDHQRQQLFASGKFSDVTLVVGDRHFKVHKLTLATSSTYFEQMFYGDSKWKESGSDEVKLEETPACEEAFETFLGYLYSGSVTVTNTNVIPIVTLADKYDVQGLRELCSNSIGSMLREKFALEAAFEWLIFAEQMRMYTLQQKCNDLICFNFDKACSLSGWLSISLEQMLAIIKRSDIVTESEYNVFLAVQLWCLNHTVSKDDLKRILSQVQFKNMTAEQLHHVENSELASMEVCKEHDVLSPFVNAAFRFIALHSQYPQGNNKPAEYQRYYLAGSKLSTFGNTESGRCAQLSPVCTFTSEAKEYKWELGKFGNAGKYMVKLPAVTKKLESGRVYTNINHLYVYMRGKIRVALTVIIRNRNGHAFVLKRSFVTQIPTINGQIIAEFPDDCPSYEPHDVVYSFSIEKHEIPDSESK